jgi:hypothetical protein
MPGGLWDPRADTQPSCPGPDCMACNGEACDLCGAGSWNTSAPRCDHDVAERHRRPAPFPCDTEPEVL